MDKKQLILNAALKLFVEQGFHGTPTSKIAKEAGVANGTLFHHFKTKDDLIIALYLHLKSGMGHAILKELGEGSDFKTVFKSMYLSNLYGMLEEPLAFKYIMQFKTSPYYAKIQEMNIDDGSAQFLSFFTDAMKTGDIRTMDMDLMFILMSNMTSGLSQYIQSKSLSKSEEHEVIAQSFDMIWRMIT